LWFSTLALTYKFRRKKINPNRHWLLFLPIHQGKCGVQEILTPPPPISVPNCPWTKSEMKGIPFGRNMSQWLMFTLKLPKFFMHTLPLKEYFL
jgi:hypothetical protein